MVEMIVVTAMVPEGEFCCDPDKAIRCKYIFTDNGNRHCDLLHKTLRVGSPAKLHKDCQGMDLAHTENRILADILGLKPKDLFRVDWSEAVLRKDDPSGY